MEFIDAVIHNRGFMLYAVLAGTLASVACGVVGSYVVARRITYIAGSIAHAILGGIGAARYLQVTQGWEFLDPLYGAVAAALAAAVVIGLVSLYAGEREDTVIGAVWALGMAVGILFITATPGYEGDLMRYLFADINLVPPEDLLLLAGLDVIVIAVSLRFYQQFLAICFDEEFARLRGLRVEFYYLLLLCLTALTVVLLVTVVGVLLAVALLTLPAAVAGHFSRRLWQMMLLATFFSLLFTLGGLGISYTPELPAGATIIVLAGVAYLLIALTSRWWRSPRA